MTAPATDPLVDCMVTIHVAGQPPRTVESHHMVKRDGVWTCTHCPAQRANDGTPITQRDEDTESDDQ